MKFRTLDSNWDWKFGTGNSDFANNSLATAYDIKTQILSWYGDCFFAMQDGIDWKNILGTKDIVWMQCLPIRCTAWLRLLLLHW